MQLNRMDLCNHNISCPLYVQQIGCDEGDQNEKKNDVILVQFRLSCPPFSSQPHFKNFIFNDF